MRTKKDASRISRQEHEIAYNRHLARKILKEVGLNEKEIRRVCRALLKYTRGVKK